MLEPLSLLRVVIVDDGLDGEHLDLLLVFYALIVEVALDLGLAVVFPIEERFECELHDKLNELPL